MIAYKRKIILSVVILFGFSLTMFVVYLDFNNKELVNIERSVKYYNANLKKKEDEKYHINNQISALEEKKQNILRKALGSREISTFQRILTKTINKSQIVAIRGSKFIKDKKYINIGKFELVYEFNRDLVNNQIAQMILKEFISLIVKETKFVEHKVMFNSEKKKFIIKVKK